MMRPLLLLALLTPPAFAEDWPQWRGPRRDGTSTATTLPLTWSDTNNVRWKTPIPGTGHSSPVVWGDRIYLTSCREAEQQRILVCVDRPTGKLLWEKVILTAPLEAKHQLNSYASSTPATDGERLYLTFQDRERMRVYAVTMAGEPVWNVSPGEFHSKHGFCSPPLLHGDHVIVNGDQDAVAFVVALDKRMGKEVWRADRPNRTRSYCPPILVDAAGHTQVVMTGSKCVAGYDATTGERLWLIDGPTEQFVASPVYHRGLILITAGFPTYHLMGIRPDGSGNVTKTHVAWRDDRKASYVPSPIAVDGRLYVVTDQGLCLCVDAATGERLWVERLGKKHSASPISGGGHLYFPDDDGVTHVLKPGPTFERVARNALGDGCVASPAVTGDALLIRTTKQLWCVGN